MTASLVHTPARLARRRATYGAAAVVLALGTALAASAEDAIVYSPWGKFCGKDNGNPAASEVCLTVKEARLETGQVIAGASMIEQTGEEKKLFRITLPLGVQLPQGARMILDQDEPMSGRYVVCLPNGCMADFDVTADFVYVRLHGDVRIYKSGYTPRALDEWAGRIRGWDADGKDVYVYFDNDMKVRAPFDALNLMQRLGLAWEPAAEESEDPPFRVHVAGRRMPRLKAYGPRVTGGNPAWEKLRAR